MSIPFEFKAGHRYEAGGRSPALVPNSVIASGIESAGFDDVIVRDRLPSDLDAAEAGVEWDTFAAMHRTGPTTSIEVPFESIAFLVDLDADLPAADDHSAPASPPPVVPSPGTPRPKTPAANEPTDTPAVLWIGLGSLLVVAALYYWERRAR